MKPSSPGRFRRVRALTVKEWRQAVRDPSTVLIAFVLPVVLLVIFGYGVNLDARGLGLGVALESDAPEARSLAAGFLASGSFRTCVAHDRRALIQELTTGKIRGIVVIPQDFTRRLRVGGDAPIQLLTDGSEPNTANYLWNYVQGILYSWLTERAHDTAQTISPPVRLVSRVWYNPSIESRQALIPGSLAVILTIIGTLLTSLVVAREWERGTMEALLTTPVSRVELLAGKFIPYFLLGLLSLAASAGVSVFLFGIPCRGSALAVMLAGGTFLSAALAQGLLISTLARNQFLASQGALISGFLPAFLLSGFIFEIASMPYLIRQFSRIIPARYLVAQFQTIFLVGDVWAVVLPKCAVLLLMAAVLLALTLKKTPRRLEG